MRTIACRSTTILLHFALLNALGAGPSSAVVFPGANWDMRTPADVGLSVASLDAIRDYLQGRGCVVRHGYLVYTWGDVTTREDVASAAKPVYSHFLFAGIEQGLVASPDVTALTYQPCLQNLNPSLGYKDRGITFRHMGNQVSCYGVSEAPGTAFDYSDWQMALFWDSVFLGVWNTTYSTVDASVLNPRLSSILQFQDSPTFMAFGTGDRPGRLAMSPRDFCRFGLLYLELGNWNGTQVLSQEHVMSSVASPLSLQVPRTTAVAAEMCAGQRAMGGAPPVPDDQYDHDGGYSWNWWINGITRTGARRWPDAESNVFNAQGHTNGKRGLAVLPCLDVVISWNDTTLDTRPSTPDPLNEVYRLLYQAAGTTPISPPADVGPVLRMSKLAGQDVSLDWSGDEGAPRPPGTHYHVLRGIYPAALDFATGSHPTAATQYTDTHAGTGSPTLLFYRITAASACEQSSVD